MGIAAMSHATVDLDNKPICLGEVNPWGWRRMFGSGEPPAEGRKGDSLPSALFSC